MKKQTLTLLLSLFIIECFGQNLKTYSGKYDKGTAAYTYYENQQGERVYHGKFEYNTDDIIGAHLNIVGDYKDGLKSGKWVETYSNGKFPYVKVNHFDKGQLNGVSTEDYYEVKKENGKENRVLISNSRVFYVEGKPKGAFLSARPPGIKIVGKVDSKGNADSIWTIKGSVYKNANGDYLPTRVDIEGKRIYKNGMLIQSKIAEVSTGKLVESYTIDTSNTKSKYLKFYFNTVEEGTKYVKEPSNMSVSPKTVDELLDLELPFSYFEKKPVLLGNPEFVAQINDLVAKFKKHRGAYDSLVYHNTFAELGNISDDAYLAKVRKARQANKELNSRIKTCFDNLYAEYVCVKILRYVCTVESLESIDERLNYLLNVNTGADMLGGGIPNMGGSNETVPEKFYNDKDYMAQNMHNYKLPYKNGTITLRTEGLIAEVKANAPQKNTEYEKLLEETKALLKSELIK